MDQLRIFITGSNGFLAQKFTEIVKEKNLPYTLLGFSKSNNRNPYLKDEEFVQADLLNTEQLLATLTEFKPTHILHTAAITSVEGCEENKDLAYETNVLLTQQLADFANTRTCHFTFISTDFVFDGKNGPYAEDDETHPLNEYGRTKVLAEQYLLTKDYEASILRTILVYGATPDQGRSNLVLWAKKQLENKQAIRVVSDQWRMPTWVDDLAKACLLSIEKRAKGVFHISGPELMSIEEAVFKIAKEYNLDQALISSIKAAEIGQDSNRPRKTGFVLEKSSSVLNFQPTSFVVSLQKIKEQLKAYNG